MSVAPIQPAPPDPTPVPYKAGEAVNRGELRPSRNPKEEHEDENE